MNNIKYIYQHAGKCDYQKNIKDIIYAAILSTLEGVTDNSPNVHLTSDHVLPHWKCVLRCCADCLCINIPDQETTKKYEETTPSIRFHIYHIIGRCTAHGGIPVNDKKICCMCEQEPLPDQLEHKDSTEIQNTSDISNTYDIHSCVTPQKQNISVHATSIPPLFDYCHPN